MKHLVIAAALVLAAACKPDPLECTQKGDENACNALCNTGKPEFAPLCFEIRARKVKACVDKDVDCTKACELWKNAVLDDTIKGYYVAKLGSDEKVTAIAKKCGTP